MRRYVARRLLLFVPTLLGVSILIFVLMRLVPGDIAEILVYQTGTESSSVQQKQIQQIRQELGLDRPVVIQYLAWLGNALRGDFGYSYTQRRPVTDILKERFPRSRELVFQRVHPEDIALRQTVDRASRDGTDVDFEHRLLFPDGFVKHVHVMARGVRDESGTLEFVGAVSDVTARKLAEDKIRQNEREFREIVEAIPELIVVLAPDGSPLYANERVLEYTGLTLEDVQAGDFRERVFHPSDVERLRKERQEALARGVPFQLEQRARAKDGRYRWFLVHYNPLRDEQGRTLRWYATGTDIDDRKRAEERVQGENLALREEIDKISMFEEIVGASPVLRAVLELTRFRGE